MIGAGLERDLFLLIAGDDRDRARAEALRDLQRRGADAAGGAVDEHRLALAQAPAQDEREVGGVVVEDQTRPLREVELRWKREREKRGGDRRLGEAPERTERRHAVTDRDGLIGCPPTHAAHDPSDLAAGHERERRFDLVLAPRLQQLREGHAGAVHVDEHT